MKTGPKKSTRDCIHFDTNIWLSLIAKKPELSKRAASHLDRIIYGKQARAGMSIVVPGETVYKLIESFRKDVDTLMTALGFVERFVIRGEIVIHNLDERDITMAQQIKEDTRIRGVHAPEFLEIAVALRTGAKRFETMDEIADNEILKGYLKQKGLRLIKFSPG
jgi:predicted nucleic acid-binding protein